MDSVSVSESADPATRVPFRVGAMRAASASSMRSARAVRGTAYAESVAEMSSRSREPGSTVHVAAGSATSTEVGTPGVVAKVTGATSFLGREADSPVTC